MHIYLTPEFRLRGNIKHKDAVKTERMEQPRTTVSFIPPKPLANLNEELFYSHLQNDFSEQSRGINKTPVQCHILEDLPAAHTVFFGSSLFPHVVNNH